MFGVRIFVCPKAPTSPYPRSSAIKNTIFGRLSAAVAVTAASGQMQATTSDAAKNENDSFDIGAFPCGQKQAVRAKQQSKTPNNHLATGWLPRFWPIQESGSLLTQIALAATIPTLPFSRVFGSQMSRPSFLTCVLLALLAVSQGCRSPYYADRGALFGGLTGAGIGAIAGNAAGNTGAGAVIGTAVGALAGAAVGENIDADLARSNAEIQARMGRQMQGAVTPQDVIAMTQAGLTDDVIDYPHSGQRHGTAAAGRRPNWPAQHGRPRQRHQRHAADAAPPCSSCTAGCRLSGYPPPVVVAPPPYYPVWGPPPPAAGFYYSRYPRGRVGWGVSVW